MGMPIVSKGNEGRASIEYALLAAFGALALMYVYLSLGPNVSRIWSVVSAKLDKANTSNRLDQSDSQRAVQLKSDRSGSTESTSREASSPSDDIMPRR